MPSMVIFLKASPLCEWPDYSPIVGVGVVSVRC